MAEDEVSLMEIMEPSDMNLSLLSESENLPEDVMLISPLNSSLVSLPSLEKHQFWMETECEISSNTNQECTVTDFDSLRETDALFGGELIPSELSQTSKVKSHKCSKCKKVFRTLNALNKHLQIHQPMKPYACYICKKGFKQLDDLTGHTLTHQVKKAYCCFYPGCEKKYCGYRSLKRHYTTKHGAYLLPPSCKSTNHNTQPCPSHRKPPKLSAQTFQFEGYTSHGTSYNNHSLSENLDLNPFQIKLPVSSQSGNLTAGGASHNWLRSVNLSASSNTMMSDQCATSFGGNVVDPKISCTWKSELNVSVHQTWKEAPSFPLSKKLTGARMGSQPSPVCPKRNLSPLVTLKMHEPQKQPISIKSGEASLSLAQHMDPVILPLPPASSTKKKQVKNKKIFKATNIPTPLLPSPRGDTQIRHRPRPAYLVSPSQVAMASFSKVCAANATLEKETLQDVEHLSKNYRLNTPSKTTGGYPSRLRSPTYLADHLLNFDPPTYTPPPMLSPLRLGTGLYFNTLPQYKPCPLPTKFSSDSLDAKDGISLKLDNTAISIKPKINVGSHFQAEIPPMRSPLLILYDEHPAQLVWAPCRDLTTNPKTKQKVTEFLDMCCSSVLPGGGTNTELALHCLHEVQGDVLAALDLLLIRGDYRTFCHQLSDYHYSGSDHWTAQEMSVFQKIIRYQTKDFRLIHKALQTKSVAQCVEYYYNIKKLKKFKQMCKGTENPSCSDTNGRSEDKNRANASKECLVDESWKYACEECGRGFLKTNSRNAHKKIHRLQERKTDKDKEE